MEFVLVPISRLVLPKDPAKLAILQTKFQEYKQRRHKNATLKDANLMDSLYKITIIDFLLKNGEATIKQLVEIVKENALLFKREFQPRTFQNAIGVIFSYCYDCEDVLVNSRGKAKMLRAL